MKNKLLLMMIAALAVTATMAQDAAPAQVKKRPRFVLGGEGIYMRDSVWRVGGFIGVNLSQTALYQWSAGGNNSFAFLLNASLYSNYKKGKAIWDNNLDAKWGMVANGLIRTKALAKSNLQKNIDVFSIRTSVGYEISKSLYVSAKLGFETQMTPSYDYSQTDTTNGRFRRVTISTVGAPAVLTIGPGLTYKPKDYFTLFFSPVEGKMTFVTKDVPGRDTTTAADGTYTDAYYSTIDETRFGLQRGKSFQGELGWELDLSFQKDIIKNVNWRSHLNVFGAYLNASYNTVLPKYYADSDSLGTVIISDKNKFIPVVKWDNDIVFKVNKWLSAVLNVKFVYQYNTLVPIDTRKNDTGKKGPDGINDIDKTGAAVTGFNKIQIFEQFGLGLSVKF